MKGEAVDEALVRFGKTAPRVELQDVGYVGGRNGEQECSFGCVIVAVGVQSKRGERDAATSALRRHHAAATGTNDVRGELSHTDLLSVDLRKSGGIARCSKGKNFR